MVKIWSRYNEVMVKMRSHLLEVSGGNIVAEPQCAGLIGLLHGGREVVGSGVRLGGGNGGDRPHESIGVDSL